MNFFEEVRNSIVGINHTLTTSYGEKPLIYLDWIASGRLYHPLEEKMLHTFGPMVANTHTESNSTGAFMTNAYHEALQLLKIHVNADSNDVIITEGSGCTGVINKFQRILGLKVPEKFKSYINLDEDHKPVVFVTHMEHHSNHTSWLETIADVVVVEPNELGEVEPNHLKALLETYKSRPLKIGSFTACSNVTGIMTPYHELAKIMHEYDGFCFVDFAASAPYVEINMHPADPMEKLDAIFFSPHKFLGGPGSCGVLIFDSTLYKNTVPDHAGGGTVLWTNPWGEKKYFDDIETREDGGTPNFLQTIRAALCIKLKDIMMENNMMERKDSLFSYLWHHLSSIKEVNILGHKSKNAKRLGMISFYIDNIPYNLLVKLLDEKYGIQVRGGCSCAGTYGHYLLNIDQSTSKHITDELSQGNLTSKPGWIRVSIHPTNTFEELETFITAIREIIHHYDQWKNDFIYDSVTGEYEHKSKVDQSSYNLFEW
ncbi:aminotransferase class V-fold PLP-dependent enzyme [Bacillus pinisoli]|uniref:aminotransferase class V-fold PLP-dependent enzyme n=1 Tax=Bacillus pinisoli TaxID=2901866 RepID=UPI001FF6D61F|nr:aminotransferase class V-fold PLP-dependent enzyme [Bacillus pinisoli]